MNPRKLTSYKIIYFSTKFFNRPLIDSPAAQTFISPSLCRDEHPKCVITSYDGHADASHVSIAHWRDLTSYRTARKTSSKLSILANWESTSHTTRLPEGSSFHLVASYRRDSDIYIPYGKVTQRSTPTTDYLGTDFSLNKALPAAWIVSNCHSPSKREDYVKELQKHIRVDVYGKCGPYRCAQSSHNHDCLSKLSKDYYFYLAFENSFSIDYLTEKIFNLGDHSMIPIVYGGANYTELLPPGSFIDARKYTPAQLAMVMNELMQNKKKYNQYFRWKTDYVMESSSLLDTLFCKVCSIVENSGNLTRSLKSAKAINQWFFGTN